MKKKRTTDFTMIILYVVLVIMTVILLTLVMSLIVVPYIQNEHRGTSYSCKNAHTVDEVFEFFDDMKDKGYLSCTLKGISHDMAINASRAYDARPENFYVEGNIMPAGAGVYIVTFEKIYSDDEIEEMWVASNECADEIVKSIPEGLTTEEKIEYLHDYMCILGDSKESFEYAENKKPWERKLTMYDLFTDGRSVCEGYTAAFSLLLSKIGVENGTVASNQKGQGHVWNSYVVNGITYYTDVYWDDTTYNEELVMNDNVYGLYTHKWFHKTFAEFPSHTFYDFNTPLDINVNVASKD